MGIYAFKAEFLYEELHQNANNGDSSHDFGKDIIPRLVAKGAAVWVPGFPTAA